MSDYLLRADKWAAETPESSTSCFDQFSHLVDFHRLLAKGEDLSLWASSAWGAPMQFPHSGVMTSSQERYCLLLAECHTQQKCHHIEFKTDLVRDFTVGSTTRHQTKDVLFLCQVGFAVKNLLYRGCTP